MISRRALLAGMAAFAATPAFAMPELVIAEEPFDPAMVHARAKDLASRPYEPRPQIPQAWRDLTYDEFQHIWFNTDNAIWENEDRPMKLDLFTAGVYQDKPVKVAFVENGVAKTLAYDLSIFHTTDQFPEMPVDETMGYSGIRMRADLTGVEKFTEFFVWQGASYFRGIANGQNYGLSARGIALRTGDPNGEEFPDFTHFWVEAAEPGDEQK